MRFHVYGAKALGQIPAAQKVIKGPADLVTKPQRGALVGLAALAAHRARDVELGNIHGADDIGKLVIALISGSGVAGDFVFASEVSGE